MATYRGSWPPTGRGRPPGRANGAHPPMPPEPYGDPPMSSEAPPSRFAAPGDTYNRGPKRGAHGPTRPFSTNNGYSIDPPPKRNFSPIPQRPPGPPYRGPESNGAGGWSSSAGSANGRSWPPKTKPVDLPPPVRRSGNGYTPQSFAPKGYGDARPIAPKVPADAAPLPYRNRSPDGSSRARPPGNVHFPPPRPSRYASQAPAEPPPPKPNRSAPPRFGNPPVLGADAPANGRRTFTPIEDYLARSDIVADRTRVPTPEPSGHAEDSHFSDSRSKATETRSSFSEPRFNGSDVQESHFNGHVGLSNPLPLGDDYSARALSELAHAIESSAKAERQRDATVSSVGGVSPASDQSPGDDHAWDRDTITPEKLESLLKQADQDEPLIADDTLMAKKPTSSRSPRAALESGRIPQPTRRSRRARHPLVVAGNAVFTLLVILGVAGGGTFVFGKQRFDAAGPLDSDKVVAIPRGLGTRDVTDLLAKEGVIDEPWLFIASAYIFKARGDDLKWGEYQFNKAASLHDVIATLVDGKVIQHKVTFAEGLTSEQIVQRILESDVLTGNIREIPREGTLLPQTYNIVRGTTREQLLQLMQRDQRRAVQEIWDHRAADLPLKSPDQLVTLASIVEKETGRPDERSRVAAVFINRLKQRMRLQSDPTIIYGLVGGKGSLGRPIMRSEIEQPTPYNTYAIDGLPPGPIANPGRASLEAAANPARTRELYFVADGTGGHVFAENLEQHQKNVTHLRQVEQQQQQQQQQILAPWPGPPSPPTTEPSTSSAAPSAAKPRARSAATKPSTTD
jgi:UPF0755 protein